MKKIIFLLLVLCFTGSVFAQTDVLPPVLVSPTDGDDNQVPDVTLNWYAASGIGSISYEVQYDTDSQFSNPVSITTEFTSAKGENLLFATTYYWRVRTMDDTGTSDWSDTFSFSTFEQIDLDDPDDEDDGINPQMDIKWKVKYSGQSLSGITFYDYQIAYDTSFNDIFKEGSKTYAPTTATTEKMTINLLRFDTTYYWRVRARHDADQTVWSERWSFKTVNMCTNQEPANGAAHQMLDVTIKWQDMPGTFEYIYELCDDPSFNTPCIFFTNDNSVTAMGLMFGTTYYWRVKAAHTTDTTDWSETWSFETLNSIDLVSPENGGFVNDMFPTFEWEETTGVGGFILYYDSDENFGDPVVDSIDGDKNTHKVLFALEMDETYYWKIKAFENGDTTDYSDVWSFTVGEEQAINDLLSDRSVHIYPNPATSDLNIEIDAIKQGVVEASLLNLLGQTVLTHRFDVSQGVNNARLNLKQLENGLYIVRLQSGNNNYMKKIVIEQ